MKHNAGLPARNYIMSYYTKNVKELREYLTQRINDQKAEVAAMAAITINTSHKTLTNRSVTGATIATKSYSLNGEKELRYSWNVPHPNGSGHQSDWLDLGEYTGETVGHIKQQATITPAEAAERLATKLASRREGLIELQRDYDNAERNVERFNAAVEALNDATKDMTWASRHVLSVR